MPLLKPATMNDILSTPDIGRPPTTPETKAPTWFASSHSSSLDGKSSSKSVKRSLPERIPAFGLLMAFLSVFCFSTASVIVRIETSLPAIEILVIRSSFQFVVYFITTLVCQYNFFGQPGHRIDLMLRSISGTISLSAVYVAYRMIPLSDASTIHFASPVFVTIFAYFLLKEPFTRHQIVTGAITLTGVVIIAKPEFIFGAESETIHEMRLEGTLLAVLASMTAAFSMISLRKLKTTPVAVVVMWYSFTLIVMGSAYLTATDRWTAPTSSRTTLSMAIVGVCGIFDQYLITLAFQYEKAGPISVVRTFNIVLSFAWEVLLLGERIEFTSILGACMICSCVILLALLKWNKESPETFAKIRSKFCCCESDSKRRSSSKRRKNVKKSTNNGSGAGGGGVGSLDPANRRSMMTKAGSTDSIDSIVVQNTVNSNVVLLMKSDDDDDDDDEDVRNHHRCNRPNQSTSTAAASASAAADAVHCA